MSLDDLVYQVFISDTYAFAFWNHPWELYCSPLIWFYHCWKWYWKCCWTRYWQCYTP